MKNIFRIDFDSNRIYGLDILRCWAILFVLIGHSTALLPQNAGHILDYFYFDGVSIFYVLSGFLIGGILIKTLEKNGATFKSLLAF